METPQLENGFTRIANGILEQLCKVNLNGSQRRILDVVFRQTYGYRRKSHEISLTFISKATELNKRQVQRELTKLIELNIILVKKEETSTESRKLEFNKDFNTWLIRQQVTKKTTGDGLDNTTGDELDTSRGDELDNQIKKERKYKERTDYKSVYEYYKSLGLKNHRAYTEDMKKAIETAMKKNKYSIEYCKTLLDRHKELVELTKNDKEFPVSIRSLSEFFGQKVYKAQHLICSEYDIDGVKYQRLQKLKAESIKNESKNREQIPTLLAMEMDGEFY